MEKGHCLQCSAMTEKKIYEKLPWMSIVSLMLVENDMESTLELLSRYSIAIPAGSLGLEFYQNLLLLSAIETKSKESKRNLVRGLSDSKKLPVMSPDVSPCWIQRYMHE